MDTTKIKTMGFIDEYESFQSELDAYYASYPSDMSEVEAEIDRVSAEHPEWGPCRRKAIIYETAAERCPVKVFRHCPFFFEHDTGLNRRSWGSHNHNAPGIGAWMARQPKQRELEKWAHEQLEPANSSGICYGPPVYDFDHHCVGFDNVLSKGLEGIISQARKRLGNDGLDERQRDFLAGVIIGNRALVRIAERFAEEAEALAADEDVAHIRRRLIRMAEAARHVPARPARSFYEALAVIMFMRQVLAGLEGLGESIYGHLDRMLQPYLDADLADGSITLEEAEDLLQAFLAVTDVKFELHNNGGVTSTTIVIGGCDRDGTPVFNDVTRMIIGAYPKLGLINPELNARLSQNHPDEYFQLLAELSARGMNVTALFNDDVLIEANTRMGKALEDARLYVGGGCQENVLQNTEINSRASIYTNLAHIFLMGFMPERWQNYIDFHGLDIQIYEGAENFEALYKRFLANLETVANQFIDQRNMTEKEGWWYNPCPVHSSTLDDCIEKAKDMLDGGTRYAGASVGMTGVGTVVDSLRAVRQMVFDEQRVSIAKMAQLLQTDFADAEELRLYAINRVPKFGSDDPEMARFAAQVFHDIAQATTGRSNTRGGRYEASLFGFVAFRNMGKETCATPDGRRAGEPLSPGMSPTPEGLRRSGGVSAALGALESIDLADYAVVSVLDAKLPWTLAGMNRDVIAAMMRRFLEVGGSVAQFNVVEPQVLLDAREHPERHSDLVVRVSGFSARFINLPEDVQNEIIQRELIRV
ncbi:MAG: pyruvate formate lyase family protein [Candidatus Sumerlaeota bacterium]